MTEQLPPDEQKILDQYLKDHPEIEAELPPIQMPQQQQPDTPDPQDPFAAMQGDHGTLADQGSKAQTETSTPVPMSIQDNGGNGMTTSEKLDRMIDLLERLPREIVTALRES